MAKEPSVDRTRLLAPVLIACTALAGCATTTSPHYGQGHGPGPGQCQACGIVARIETLPSGRSAPPATGAVLGGIVGAVAGRQISKDTGGGKGNQNVSTVAGAAAGAVAGNAIQDRVTGDSYEVTVRMDDGRTVVVHQNALGGIAENTYVRIVNGRAVIR